ncbi:methyltransferase-like protein 22 [Eurosta solidaginis]|uniref:methyltransferase-like protein 22 n=1 Tax=Eurosta solidaginis TaxID=178769 RepID=UPI003530A62D
MYKVKSEIYEETNYSTIKVDNGRVLSKFKFTYPPEVDAETTITLHNGINTDKDGDLVVKRKAHAKRSGVIQIEHSEATELRLVGLQVWRGALLLADYIFHKHEEFCNMSVLELGAGVGLTSIAAAIYSSNVVCTDVNVGGILDLIRANIKHNTELFKIPNSINVLEFDFLQPLQDYSGELLETIDNCDVVVAADVIYDDTLTDAFINVMDTLFERGNLIRKGKTIYIALEKRYVFTLAEMDTVAPMFEYFLRKSMHKSWKIEYIATDFPQYFEYERSRHLVMLKVTYNK